MERILISGRCLKLSQPLALCFNRHVTSFLSISSPLSPEKQKPGIHFCRNKRPEIDARFFRCTRSLIQSIVDYAVLISDFNR
jgi:hypothetical protein